MIYGLLPKASDGFDPQERDMHKESLHWIADETGSQ
jgi:hypothetical protein